jgi:hypothetical protein
MFMAAMAMVLPRKIVQDFFVKIQNFDPHFKNLYLENESGFKKLTLVLLGSLL